MEGKVNIGDAFSYGFDRLTTSGGGMLLAAYILVQLANQVSTQSLIMEIFSESASAEGMSQLYPFALDLPIAISGGLFVLIAVVGLVLNVVAMRAFYANIDSLPTADHTRRLARTAVVFFIVSLIFVLAVGIGFVFLLFPGIFLLVSLFFAPITVAIEDAGVIEAFERSWELTSGNRIRLFALGLVFVVGAAVIGGIVGFIGAFAPVVSGLGTTIVNSLVTVFGIAVQIGVYRQLANDAEAADSASW